VETLEEHMLSLEPATRELTRIVSNIRDDQLDMPTPSGGATVGAMLTHVDDFSQAFTAAALKSAPPDGPPPTADAARLGDDWRTRIPRRLADLATAWQSEVAWSGETRAGGQEMPATVAGRVAANEAVVHAWDIAVATGQALTADPDVLAAARTFVEAAVVQSPNGTPGLFGAPVDVPADASPLDQLIALTGRDPAWS
jgi:uncharacterized protein (TIGR03086 family)